MNAVLPLPEDAQIESLEYLPHEQAPEIVGLKRPVVDVKCYDQKGRIFIVEMQFEWADAFISRMIYNTSKAYVNQLKKGQDYDRLCPVYGIAVLSEDCAQRSEWSDDWYHEFNFQHQENKDHSLKEITIIFLELSKFNPKNHSEKKLAVLWMRFLREIKDRKSIPEEFEALEPLQKACEIAHLAGYNEVELESYNKFVDSVLSEKTLLNAAERRGEKKGALEEKQAVARAAIINGLDNALISKLTGLSEVDIQKLR